MNSTTRRCSECPEVIPAGAGLNVLTCGKTCSANRNRRLTRENGRARTAAARVSAADRILRLLAEYHPLPLTIDDLVDELPYKRSSVHTAAGQLVRDGLVRREGIKQSPGRGGIPTPHFWLIGNPE